jgi:cytoskeletal protein CcmA (bactofilin family)
MRHPSRGGPVCTIHHVQTVQCPRRSAGRFLGKLVVEQALEVHRTAEIKGTFKAGRLVIPAGNVFRWREPLVLQDADIAGELLANVHAAGTVTLRATARFFGDMRAANLVVESGAVVVGQLRLGAASTST